MLYKSSTKKRNSVEKNKMTILLMILLKNTVKLKEKLNNKKKKKDLKNKDVRPKNSDLRLLKNLKRILIIDLENIYKTRKKCKSLKEIEMQLWNQILRCIKKLHQANKIKYVFIKINHYKVERNNTLKLLWMKHMKNTKLNSMLKIKNLQ